MKIFIEWIVTSVTLSIVLYLLASFGGLSFLWFLNVDGFVRFVYGVLQIAILVGSWAFVVDMNEKVKG